MTEFIHRLRLRAMRMWSRKSRATSSSNRTRMWLMLNITIIPIVFIRLQEAEFRIATVGCNKIDRHENVELNECDSVWAPSICECGVSLTYSDSQFDRKSSNQFLCFECVASVECDCSSRSYHCIRIISGNYYTFVGLCFSPDNRIPLLLFDAPCFRWEIKETTCKSFENIVYES